VLRVKLSFILLLTLSVSSLAEEHLSSLTTTDGITYKLVTITRIDPDGLQIISGSVSTKIPFEKLSPTLQQKYGYDPTKASAFRDQQAKALAEQWEKRRYHIKGVVFQKVPEGLIIVASTPDENQAQSKVPPANNAKPLRKTISGTIFLVGYDGKETDSNPIDIEAYADGDYSYTNTDGDLITLNRYSFVIPK